ncbi:unnamed protein product [Schistosoma margrebowiei]|uniref:Uncharacterized protein n=1 Tax=Schistosoma margrebowiei TaxID=48269 RepID=A0A3P8FHI4_9TREM|nr:unnamed protein product [Schistosoma margrebowiei]
MSRIKPALFIRFPRFIICLVIQYKNTSFPYIRMRLRSIWLIRIRFYL